MGSSLHSSGAFPPGALPFSLYTLGCKVNQLESEAIAGALQGAGFSLLPGRTGKPLLVVINTCTVTSMAEQKARRLIRKVRRDHPSACVIVTGCYAQMEGAAIRRLEDEGAGATPEAPGQGPLRGRLFVIPGEQKDRLLDLPGFLKMAAARGGDGEDWGNREEVLPGLIASWLEVPTGRAAPVPGAPGAAASGGPALEGVFRFRPDRFSFHSRGFLKIQDGCDRRCAYCRVSLARGKSRSLGAGEVLELLAALECRGLGEAVLTGVNITQYRDDARRLPELLDFLLENTRYIRLRLSSIEPEPGGFGPDFIRVLSHPRIRPHFHLSLQSGSAEILAGMGRPYNPADIGEGIRLLRSVRDDPFLACDIITGFPREGEGDFEKTLEFCEQIGFAGIHAFPYSPRPGTAAFDFSGRVSEREAVRRVGLLRGLAQKGRREYLRRWEGRVLEAVVEAGKGLPRGFFPALSENYLKLLVAGGDEQLPPAGTLLRCRILEPGRGGGKLPEASRFDALAERIPGEFPENFPKQEKPLAAEDKKLYT